MNIEKVSFNNTFIEYLCSFEYFDQDRLTDMMKRYLIGATEDQEPIFWHINAVHRITNGHIITMSGETGEVYDHSWFYSDGRPTCLFGEHLLTEAPTQTIALVKDEMAAAIMSCFPTPYVWLATGKDDIAEADLSFLEGRSVVVFPNKGDYQRWQDNLRTTRNLRLHISDLMEKAQGNVTTIAQMMLSQQTLRPTEEEAALMRLTAAHPSLASLVDVLGLEVVSVTRFDASSAPKAATKGSTATSSPVSTKTGGKTQAVKSEQETRWHGRNAECHQCRFSHEGINGT